jgi:nitroreductase/FMN reductase [NAD(P)H]
LARLLARRTHRQYTDQPIDDDLFDVLLACGLSASSKSDLQQASIVVVDDADKRAQIASWIPSMPWLANAPRLLVFCGDHSRLRIASDMRNKPFPNDNVDQFMNAAVDAALVMQTFTLAAESVGLGCCPISEVRSYIDALSELLALPDHVFPIAALCVGYPSREGFVSMRLPTSLTVHRDQYDASARAAKIDAYDQRRDQRFSIPQANQKETDRFGVADFYGWSEDKTRQYSTPQRPDFLVYLKARGFAMA